MLTKVAIAIVCGFLIVYCGNILFTASAQTPSLTPEQRQQQGRLDAVVRAQEPTPIQMKRPEQQKTAHDNSNVFDGLQAMPSSPAYRNQPEAGKTSGFDFYRVPSTPISPTKTPMRLGKTGSGQAQSHGDSTQAAGEPVGAIGDAANASLKGETLS